MDTKHQIVCLSSLLLMSCGSYQRSLAFTEVTSDAAMRSGHDVIWDHGDGATSEQKHQLQQSLERQLGVDDVVRIGLLNSPRLQAKYEQLGVAQADMVQAGLWHNPLLSVEGHIGGGDAGVDITILQRFLDLFFVPLRRHIGVQGFEKAKAMITGEIVAFATDLRREFYRYQGVKHQRELMQSVVSAFGLSYDLAKRLHAAGNMTTLDFAQERATYEESKISLAKLELEELQRREKMNRLMGLWGENAAKWSIGDRLADPREDDVTLGDVERKAIEKSLDLAQARLEIVIAENQLQIARPGHLFSDMEIGSVTENQSESGWATGLAGALPLPFFDQGQAASGKADAILRRARENYRDLAIQIRSEARAAVARLQSLKARVTYRKQILLPLRRRIVEETQKQYNGMIVGPFQLLTAKKDEIESTAAYIGDLQQYWQAQVDVEQLFGGQRLEPQIETIADID